MITAPLLEADWHLRRLTGRGLRRDRLDPDAADPDAPATFSTSVVRLPDWLSAGLQRIAEGVAATQPGHYVVPAASIHVTICGPVPPDVEGLEVVRADLRVLAPDLRATRLRVACLGVGDTSVFAALEASDRALLATRRELARRWSVDGRGGLAGMFAVRLLWANLVRFSTPPSAGFLEAFAARRRTRSQAFAIDAIELVRTNRAMAPERTTVLERIAIEPRVAAGRVSPGGAGARPGSRSAGSGPASGRAADRP